MMETLFLFGAGASYGSGPCFPTRPPLGREYFSALRRRGGAAAQVSADLAAMFDCNPEAAMDRMIDEHSSLVPALLRQMAVYFSEFKVGKGNLYVQLVAYLVAQEKDVVFATLNYDALLEGAITLNDRSMTFSLLDVPGNMRVLKPHGSCHFLPALGGNNFIGGTMDIGGGAAILSAPVRIASSAREVQEFCRQQDRHNNLFSPAIALYAKGKRVLHCPEFVKQQQRDWTTAAARAANVFVVGVALNDEDSHIWDALANSNAQIFYAGGDHDVFNRWCDARRVGKPKSAAIAHTFEQALEVIKEVLKQ